MAVDINSITSNILSVGKTVFTVLVAGGFVIAITWMMLRWRRYTQYRCIIIDKSSGGTPYIELDDAGIFLDKRSNMKLFYLKKAKVGMVPDNVPYITAGNKRFVFMLKRRLKDYRFINMNVDDDTPVCDVTEADINWGLAAFAREKKRFVDSMLMQMLPYIAIGFTGIIILAMVMYVLKNFEVLKAVSENLLRAAEATRTVNGTMIVTGGAG